MGWASPHLWEGRLHTYMLFPSAGNALPPQPRLQREAVFPAHPPFLRTPAPRAHCFPLSTPLFSQLRMILVNPPSGLWQTQLTWGPTSSRQPSLAQVLSSFWESLPFGHYWDTAHPAAPHLCGWLAQQTRRSLCGGTRPWLLPCPPAEPRARCPRTAPYDMNSGESITVAQDMAP